MKVRIRVCNKILLLSPEQVDKLVELIDGVETLDEDHVGEQNGYTGYKNSYVYKFNKFDPEFSLDASVWSEMTYDKYKTLHNYRQQPKENEDA